MPSAKFSPILISYTKFNEAYKIQVSSKKKVINYKSVAIEIESDVAQFVNYF